MEEQETVPDDELGIGVRLKQLRVELALSQTEFAQELGLTSPSLVSDVERGIRDPSKRMLLAIHNKFGRDLNWLFYGKQDELYSLQCENNEKIKQLEEQGQKIQQFTGGIDELNRQIQGYAQTVKEKNQQIDELKEERIVLLKENGRLKDELLSLIRKQ
jgi:transcriptional regulator with XRE-family HTH domain